MKTFQKIVSTALVALMLCVSAAGVLAEESAEIVPINAEIETEIEAAPTGFYKAYTGTVKEIADRENGTKMVSLESEEYGPANFIISDTTYMVDEVKIALEAEITGFYETGRPMILIYPPQYNIAIVAGAKEGVSVKADKFDKDMLSYDKNLKLNLSEDTQIIWENGTQINWIAKPTVEQLEAVLADRQLIVTYSITTRSLPPQTPPVQIIVFSGPEADSFGEGENADVLVNLEKVGGGYKDENGVVMVPVRAVAQGLGCEVLWNENEPLKVVVDGVSFEIGADVYTLEGGLQVKLGASSRLIDGATYVPVNFFRHVILTDGVYMFDGEVRIISEA